MAKMYGLFGAMTGKVADVVMAVRAGEQVVRKYQPVVLNPNTDGQQRVRAKLKLASQLAAVLGSNIAIPRKGSVSSRNAFISKNYNLLQYENGTATIEMGAIQLTKSEVAMSNITATSDGAVLNVATTGSMAGDFDRVVYIAVVRQSDTKLRVIDSKVVSEPGNDGKFPVTLTGGLAGIWVYAYAIRFNSETSKVKYGELTVLSSEVIAKLISTRQINESDITLTETKSVYVPPQV